MSFSIVDGSPQTVWVPLAANAGSLFVGQLVSIWGDGAAPIDNFWGTGDIVHQYPAKVVVGTTGVTSIVNNLIYGVVIGTNRKTPLYNSTLKAEYITYAQPSGAGSDDYVLHGGENAYGDRLAMVKVALIDTNTIIRGRIFNATYGTAPGAKTAVSGGASVVGFSALECPTLAGMSTIYFRSGNAAGTYRINNVASSTEVEFRSRIYGSTATTAYVGSKVCVVNLKPHGISRMQVNTTAQGARGMFIDSNASCDANYGLINVIRLNLSSSGNEYVDFKFMSAHISPTLSTS